MGRRCQGGDGDAEERTETRKRPGRAKVEKVVKAEKKVASEAGIKKDAEFWERAKGLRAHVCHP